MSAAATGPQKRAGQGGLGETFAAPARHHVTTESSHVVVAGEEWCIVATASRPSGHAMLPLFMRSTACHSVPTRLLLRVSIDPHAALPTGRSPA